MKLQFVEAAPTTSAAAKTFILTLDPPIFLASFF
jgi:hypothetical protein